MKKLLKSYTYTLSLAVIVFIFSLFFSMNKNYDNLDKYISITVDHGDTLWKMAEVYKTEDLSRDEFINWIITHNEISANSLVPGDSIIIPVTKTNLSLASKQ
ncbi:cell division suppressor protein YneA [Peribacillus huizhouensis]|uniref:Cell division protein YceG involved in septum cleavage n=1 Tax=Peribacillus huizhouensis TaxID=1501239 RepID=A0ABR6CY74_9BACI|nr:LysM peptidoglycan-binding domain-containing protein [Peribacillus huizhouensis]MBA9029247.1 cell division protein YceG involved in septum cleavage [Peribacillus huizhouensis]